jgi:hypothetical protein
VADFGGQTQMVVKIVVKPIVKLSKGAVGRAATYLKRDGARIPVRVHDAALTPEPQLVNLHPPQQNTSPPQFRRA